MNGGNGSAAWTLVETAAGRFEALTLGGDAGDAGEAEPPVVIVGTALTPDEMVPWGRLLRSETGRRMVAYRRRGYGRSRPADAPGTMAREAADCLAVLDAAGIGRAIIAGTSYAAAVAITTAALAPEQVERVVVVESPPSRGARAIEFREANRGLQRMRERHGVDVAALAFHERLGGEHWRSALDALMPGAAEASLRDAAAFFDADLPALLGWELSDRDAARITAPVLVASGAASEPWFHAEARHLAALLPHATAVVIPGGGHSVALTHARELAREVSLWLDDGRPMRGLS